MERRRVFRCPVCGGVDVSARAYVNPNFMPRDAAQVDWLDEYEVICDDCAEDVGDWDNLTELEFDSDGLVVIGDGRHITLEEWARENPVRKEAE